MKRIIIACWLGLFSTLTTAAEFSGIFLADEIKTTNGETLVLNGVGLREKLWVDVYVGSLYLPRKSNDVAEILSLSGPWRVQLDFIYKEVAKKKLLAAWRKGFEKNQNEATLKRLRQRIEQFYQFFDGNAVAKDQYIFDYIPNSGSQVSKNGTVIGLIPGEDFKNALLEIWLGNHPADRNLKRGMLGL